MSLSVARDRTYGGVRERRPRNKLDKKTAKVRAEIKELGQEIARLEHDLHVLNTTHFPGKSGKEISTRYANIVRRLKTAKDKHRHKKEERDALKSKEGYGDT